MMNEKLFQKIRAWEGELAYAKPSRAATLSRKIARQKGRVFSNGQ
jgi:hypothetical protein